MKSRHRIWLAGVLLMAPLSALAQSASPTQAAHDDGKAFGAATNPTVQGSVNNGNVGNAPDYNGTSLPQSSYSDGNMYDAATAAAQNDQAAQVIGTSFPSRSTQPVSKSDSFLNTYWGVAANPNSVLPSFSGQYGDCITQPGGQGPPTTQMETCDQYSTLVNNTCTNTRDVEVQANPIYNCTVDSPTQPEACTVSHDVTTQTDDTYTCTATGPTQQQTCSIGRDVEVQQNNTYQCDRTRINVDEECDNDLTPTCTQTGICQSPLVTNGFSYVSGSGVYDCVASLDLPLTYTSGESLTLSNPTPLPMTVQIFQTTNANHGVLTYDCPTGMSPNSTYDITSCMTSAVAYFTSKGFPNSSTHQVSITAFDNTGSFPASSCQNLNETLATPVSCCTQAGGTWSNTCSLH